MALLLRSHPWHGIPIGEDAPQIVNTYVETVPSDTVKYEIDKKSGFLKVDRPQKYSSICPTLYGFILRPIVQKALLNFALNVQAVNLLLGMMILWIFVF